MGVGDVVGLGDGEVVGDGVGSGVGAGVDVASDAEAFTGPAHA